MKRNIEIFLLEKEEFMKDAIYGKEFKGIWEGILGDWRDEERGIEYFRMSGMEISMVF